VADFNGDYKADFAVTNYLDNKVNVRLGDGQGGFTVAPTISVGNNAFGDPHGVAGGDFNGDAKPDLAVINSNSASVTILVNQYPGPAPNPSPNAAAAGDVTARVRALRGKTKHGGGRSWQRLRLRNVSGDVLGGPLALVFSGMKKRVRLSRPDGLTQNQSPAHSPYRLVPLTGDGVLTPGEDLTVVVRFLNPLRRRVAYTLSVLAGPGPL
jgi:hypothetical protein